MIRNLFVILAMLVASPTFAPAQPLTLGGPFSEHMVLQRDVPVCVWGTGSPGSKVSVSIQNSSVSGVVARDGSWSVELPPCGPTPLNESIVFEVSSGQECVTLRDVVIGDVWLCSGQSNMRYRLGRREDEKNPASPLIFSADLEKSSHPGIRLLAASGGKGSTPPERKWARCDPSTSVGFSAIGYFFGASMHEKSGVPIGLIDLGQGGQSLRAFLPADLVSKDPRLAAFKPSDPQKKSGSVYAKDVCWLAPYSLRGVLWYQGESDITRANDYSAALRVMVDRWRSDFRQPHLPFFVVELPGYLGKANDPQDQTIQAKWRSRFQEAQARFVAETPGACLAKAADLGEAHEIHPRDKRAVADRLVKAVAESGNIEIPQSKTQ